MSQSSARRRTDDQLVLDHLKNHPDFLTRYPELLDVIDVPHDTGAASSLLLHQIDRLKQSSSKLRQRIERMTTVAGDNEQLLKRVQHLVLALMDAESLTSLLETLHVQLREQLSADASALLLIDEAAPAVDASLAVSISGDAAELKPLMDFRQRGSVLCGRLQVEKLTPLFGDQAGKIASAALIPVRYERELGILAVGSYDAERFSPDLGTLFLDFLGAALARRLSGQLATPQAQSEAS
jgi:hypothetical protein